MARVEQVVYSILEFLEDQIKGDTLGEEAAESIEVAAQCLETAYGINTRDDEALRPDRSLLQIFSTVYGTQDAGGRTDPYMEPDTSRPAAPDVCSATPTTGAQPTAEDKRKAEDFKNQGNELMKRERYSEAVECYTKSVSLDATNAVYYSNRAAAYSKLDNHKRALEDCDRAIKIDPNYSKAYGRMGLAFTHLNDLRRAKDAYAKAVELEPDNDSYQTNLRIAEKKLKDANLGGGGAPNLGPGLGGMDLGSFLNNPALMNAASTLLQNPQMQNMMSSLMGQAMQPEGNQNQDQQASMANLLQVGQQIASQIQQQNPDLVQQIQGMRNRQNQPGGGGGAGPQSEGSPEPPTS
ncbi:small glutamine-rich tetratricopeptide repeat-containing protein alpha-like [Acanthaster planci]|uniref:Small glutamine-rich tetratricopeptide repeat-containing protein alpha-like n=1 Tax=Acanthaster planci TaxID=133434 RepID=A0A8B7Z9S4_ACAPL|nr:small glutamine-rich tetratricopeptide repeat-containing protein alpha-like [Acanthaster planci]